MKAVIPVGKGRPSTLPYVLRSLVRYADVDELVTVGERPAGIEPDLHIDSPNTDKPHMNILGHLARVAEVIDGEWVWTDDDTFTIKPWTPAVYVRPFSIAHMLRENANKGHWSHAVRASIKVMQAQGYDPEQVRCGTAHRPWLVTTDRVAHIVATLTAAGGGSFKALYVAGLDDVIEADDHKIRQRGVPHPSADVVSVFNDSWRYNAGRIIRERFTEPTRWESTPTEDMAVSTGGRARGPRRHHRR